MGRLSGCLSRHAGADDARRDRARSRARGPRPAHARTVDFGAAADVGVDGTAKSRYLLFVEFQDGAAPADFKAFAAAFDEGLCIAEPRLPRAPRGRGRAPPARVVPLAPAGRALPGRSHARATCRASSPASSTTRRRNSFGSTRPPASSRASHEKARHESHRSRHRRSQRSCRVDADRRRRADEAGSRASHRMVTERTDARIAESITELARLRAARGPRLRGLGPAVRERVRGRAAPQGAPART